MNDQTLKRLMLGMAHGTRAMRTPHGIQSAFSRSIQIFAEIEPLLNELKADNMVKVGDDACVEVMEAGFAELHKTDFEAVFEELKVHSGDVAGFRQLIDKIKKTPLPDIGLDLSSFEWTGTVYNTTPRKLAEYLYEALGGTSKIQIIEDQVVYADNGWDLMFYNLVNSGFDDTILPGHDDYRTKTVYMGVFRKFEAFIKGFATALDRDKKRYSFEYYEIDEEEDIVGEEYSLYSKNL